jgi:hypothetical protein
VENTLAAFYVQRQRRFRLLLMAFKHCELRSCSRIFDDGGQPIYFCSPTHRDEAHRQLKRLPCSDQPRTPPAAYSTSPTLAPTRRTMSTAAAWLELSERAADIPDSLAADSRVLALETRRRVL